MVGLEFREVMGLAIAVDDLHIADVSRDPLLGKLDRIEWAVRSVRRLTPSVVSAVTKYREDCCMAPTI